MPQPQSDVYERAALLPLSTPQHAMRAPALRGDRGSAAAVPAASAPLLQVQGLYARSAEGEPGAALPAGTRLRCTLPPLPRGLAGLQGVAGSQVVAQRYCHWMAVSASSHRASQVRFHLRCTSWLRPGLAAHVPLDCPPTHPPAGPRPHACGRSNGRKAGAARGRQVARRVRCALDGLDGRGAGGDEVLLTTAVLVQPAVVCRHTLIGSG